MWNKVRRSTCWTRLQPHFFGTIRTHFLECSNRNIAQTAISYAAFQITASIDSNLDEVLPSSREVGGRFWAFFASINGGTAEYIADRLGVWFNVQLFIWLSLLSVIKYQNRNTVERIFRVFTCSKHYWWPAYIAVLISNVIRRFLMKLSHAFKLRCLESDLVAQRFVYWQRRKLLA